MTRVADFLRARIAEDEARFEAAVAAEVENLRHDGMPDVTVDEIRQFWLRPESKLWWRRMLVRCNTDRRIVAMHDQDHECPESEDDSCGYWDDRACLVIRLLAVPYADHPDYDEEWRP